MQIEREIKFRLPEQAARRVWRIARAAPAQRPRIVTSIYYDTLQERLRRGGIALRLRRDGRRWVQTLKADSAPKAGFTQRAEWEVPANTDRLDVAAFPREETMAATGVDLARLAPRLRPLFKTRFSRKSAAVMIDSSTRAEIRVDRGQLSAGERSETLGEIEIELKAGNAAALLRYASRIAKLLALELEFESKAERGYRLAAGKAFAAPRKWRRPALSELATPADAFSAMFATALAQAGANARGVARGSDPEYLHQMRVGLRRLRSALRAFRDLVPKRAPKPVAVRLRKLMPALGAARDWDVFCDGIARIGVQDPQRAPAIAQLLARARSKRGVARRRARAVADSPQLQAFLLRALRWLHAEPWKRRADKVEHPLVQFACQSLERLQRRALTQARDMDWQDTGRRHRLRIRMKRLRYACDFFAPSFAGASARPYIKRLEALQDILGDLNDIAVARRLLAEIAPRASPPGVAAGAAHVRQVLVARERMLVLSLEPAWTAFEKRRPFWSGG
jgi:inorganic triphosphatase YgiF